MGLTTGIDTYVTTEEAGAYIAMHYLSTDEQRMAWENAGTIRKSPSAAPVPRWIR
ncbi:hypothetical protein [Christensenella minuta]|uniref:hypothetical protein n=1 Tax=Christensenella minuta TaxID=626937 RepID=UPI0013C510D6|nr:hypothetical protein [Christensenella minuta]